jgi:hypothetical protein
LVSRPTHSQAPTQYQEWLENQYGGIEISELVPDRSTDLSKPVSETFSFATQSEVIGDKIFVNPMLFYAADKTRLSQKPASYPFITAIRSRKVQHQP